LRFQVPRKRGGGQRAHCLLVPSERLLLVLNLPCRAVPRLFVCVLPLLLLLYFSLCQQRAFDSQRRPPAPAPEDVYVFTHTPTHPHTHTHEIQSQLRSSCHVCIDTCFRHKIDCQMFHLLSERGDTLGPFQRIWTDRIRHHRGVEQTLILSHLPAYERKMHVSKSGRSSIRSSKNWRGETIELHIS